MTVETRELQLEAQPTEEQGAPQPLERIFRALPARQGAFWVFFALAVPKVLGPVFTIALRRFLGPGVAGIFDLAVAPYKLLDNFRNFGTGPALIYERTVDRAAANTAWTLNMLFAVAVTAVAQALAGPITEYYDHPEVEGVLRLLSLAYIFASVGSVHFFLLARDLDFRARSIPAVGQVIIAGDLAVLFAIWGFGVGSLVARELASVILGAIFLWAVYPFRPRVQIVPHLAWKLLHYGVWVGAGLTVLFLSQNVDVFIAGHFIRNTSDIGYYTTSWKLAFIAAGVFTLVASSMVFPTLSRLQDDVEALRVKLLKSIRQVGLVMFPAAALLAAMAPVVIVPLLGTKWTQYRDSFLVLSLLAIYAGNRTMLSIFFEGYKSIGKPWIVLAYNTVKLTVMVPAMIYSAQFGVMGLALVYVPLQLVEIPVALLLADRMLRVSPAEVWRASQIPILAMLLMVAAVIGAELLLVAGLHAGDTFTLLSCLCIAAAAYPAALLMLDRRVLGEARAVVLKGL